MLNEKSSNLIPKLDCTWTVAPHQVLGMVPKERPKFKNKVEEIIYILEHENDPLVPTDLESELVKSMSEEIVKDIDKEIMKTIKDIVQC